MAAKNRDTGSNPLLEEFDTPHGTPPFGSIRLEHYMPAFEEGIRRLRAEADAIANDPAEPTFENTVEALQYAGELLERVEGIFFALNHSNTSEQMESIANDVQPMLTAVGNDINHNSKLFDRVKRVYDARGQRDYTPEEAMLLENTYRNFVRSGTGLSQADKQTYREITTELGRLSLQFVQNVRAATNAFSLNIPPEQKAKVRGLPADVRRMMAADARERGQKGWTVTLQPASYENFMMFSGDRELKEKVWRARLTLCYGPEHDNRDICRRMAELRLRLANLLGYATLADMVLEERMARDTVTVNGFLGELLDATKEWAEEDYRRIQEYARSYTRDKEFTVRPWDLIYFIEKYRRKHFNLDTEQVKRYIRLDNAERGLFMLAEKLYGIRFKPSTSIEPYHPDVRVYEVFDADGSFLAVLYMDYYARKSKTGGAWMTDFRPMYTTREGREVRPLVSCCFNFGKPAREGEQARLVFRDLETLLHEFGHALHGIFARGRYASLTGTNVYRDFVELPSQLMENWASEREFLDMWTSDEQSGECMPAELIESIRRSKKFMAAYNNLTQLSYGMNDMAWHTVTEPVTADPGAFEAAAMAPAAAMPRESGVCMSTSFSHIFGGGYSAGYYSYKWAEVLDADAYAMFEERGIFDRETARSFRENVLSRGGSEPPMDLYVRWRGHRPQIGALIERIRG